MITLSVDLCNPVSQDFYDKTIYNLQFHRLVCTCGHSGCLTIHGYYYRSVKYGDSCLRLRICRVICSDCGRTHALLPASMVPYSQISTKEQIRLRYSPDMKEIFLVEPDNSLTPIRLLNKQENADIKREKIRLCRGDD